MKKFSFEFDNVLNHRKINEEVALMALGEAQRLLERERNKRDQIVAQFNQVVERAGDVTSAKNASQYLQVEENYIQGTKYRITLADLDISRAGKVVQEAINTYLEAQKQIRAIEYLREKAYEEYLREVDHQEQTALDDILCAKAIQQKGLT